VVHGHHRLSDRAQLAHVKEHILGAVKRHGDLPVAFARMTAYGFTAPFTFSVEPHPTALRMLPLIRRSEPLEIDEGDLGTPIEVKNAVRRLRLWSTDAEWDDGTSYVAYVQSDRFQKRDLVSMRVLLDASPRDFWKMYLRELNGYDMERDVDRINATVWLPERNYMLSLMHGMHDMDLREWLAYLEYSIDYHCDQFLPEVPAESYFRVRNPLKRRKHHHFVRKKRSSYTEADCIEATHRMLPAAVGNVFLSLQPHLEGTRDRVTRVVRAASSCGRTGSPTGTLSRGSGPP
jgi:hypothetical protein